ncbi:PriCT-2 domain-containing protein [bacterium]|nr:PriCT-2 domain-containing protein [bacterium]
MTSSISNDSLALWSDKLKGLPDDFRYLPVNDEKVPIDPKNGLPQKGWEKFCYTPLQLDQMNGVVKAIGLHLGAKSGGIAALDFDGAGSEMIFEKLTGHSAAELPKTVRWDSGLDGHYQAAFRIPKMYWDKLSNKDFRDKANLILGASHFEMRWSGQSVITGLHPNWQDSKNKTGKGKGLFGRGHYAFQDHCSPQEVSVADAPDWLIQFWLERCSNSSDNVKAETNRTRFPKYNQQCKKNNQQFAEYGLQYDVFRATEILSEALQPADDFNDYQTWTNVGMALKNLSEQLGDPMHLFSLWHGWSKEQENYDSEDKCLCKWNSFDRKNGSITKFPSLLHLAKENGYEASKTWNEFLAIVDTKNAKDKSRKKKIQELMTDCYELAKSNSDWSHWAENRAKLFETAKVSKEELHRRLFEMVAEEFALNITDIGPDQRTTRTLQDAADEQNNLKPLIPGFVHRGLDGVLYGDKGTGKTLFALALSYYSCCGGTPLDRDEEVHGTDLGRTLWIGSDGGEGAEAMVRTYVDSLSAPKESLWRQRLNLWTANNSGDAPWAFTVRGLVQLFRELDAAQKSGDEYNLVVIDTLKCVLDLGGIDFAIGPMGTLMRLVQAAASKFNVAILWLHHTKAVQRGVSGIAGGNTNITQVPFSVISLHKLESSKHNHLVRCVVEKYRGEGSRSFNYTLDQENGLFEVVELSDDCDAHPLLYQVWISNDVGISMNDLVLSQDHVASGTTRNKMTSLKKEGLVKKQNNRWWCTKDGALKLLDTNPELKAEVQEWISKQSD